MTAFQILRKRGTALLIVSVALLMSSCYKKLYHGCQTENETVQQANAELQQTIKSVKVENALFLDSITRINIKNDQCRIDNTKLLAENAACNARLEAELRKTKKFDLYFRQLCCDNTTEGGADEVYITVLGSKIGSGDIFRRIPGDSQHWDMNDGNQPTDNPTGDSHCLTNRTLFSGELKPGESYYIHLAVCEEDGGTTRDYQALAGRVMQQIPNPYVAAAGQFINVITQLGLFFHNTDDWMGMIGVKIINIDGAITVQWTSKDGIIHSIPDGDAPSDPLKREFRMNHDGSNYVGWFGVRYN